jgi:two-component sensor histidine kinase
LSGPLEEIVVKVFSPDRAASEESILLRELNHRINRELASAINLVSAAVVRAEGAEAKRALTDVVELLHGYGDVHRALAMPEREALIDAATYIRRLGCAMRNAFLDRMDIRLALATESLPLQPARCWRLGLIVHELVTNVAKHACFDARAGMIRVKLARIGAVVNCIVLDNGSRSARDAAGRELRISNDLAKALGGRVEHGSGTEFTSVVLSFPLVERERKANWVMAARRMRPPRRLRARASDAWALCAEADFRGQGSHHLAIGSDPNRSPAHGAGPVSACSAPDVLGELLSPCHRMDAS